MDLARRQGFTLIELMIVVVIIGILAAIAVPKFMDVSRKAKEIEADPVLKQILTLEERYRAREGSYATDIALLEGGPSLVSGTKYYDLRVDAHASGFCAVAEPNGLGSTNGVRPRSLDADGTFYRSASCS